VAAIVLPRVAWTEDILDTPILVKPQFSVLTMDQIEQVHAYSLKNMATTGVKIESPRARRFFPVRVGVTLGKVTVCFWTRVGRVGHPATPTAVDVFNRHGDFAFRVGEDHARFGVRCHQSVLSRPSQ